MNSELAAAACDKAPVRGTQECAGDPSVTQEDGARLEFAWKVHAYTNDYIRFADTKAAAVIAWCSGVIAALYAAKVHHHFTKAGGLTLTRIDWSETGLGLLSLAAFVLLFLSAGAGILAIWPRLWSARQPPDEGWLEAVGNRVRGFFAKKPPVPRALIFWEAVQAQADKDTYAVALMAESQRGFVKEVSSHVFTLGHISQTKYHWVTRAISLAFVGSFLGAIAALLT